MAMPNPLYAIYLLMGCILLLALVDLVMTFWVGRLVRIANEAKANAARAEAVATAALAAVEELKSTGVIPFDIPKKDA
jgi:uncharacterized membrane protein